MGTQSNPTSKIGFRNRSPVSNSAPPSPNPTCPVHPISGLIKATPVLLSSSCSQLPRDQDRKQPDSGRISAKPNVCDRSEMKTHYGTQQTRYFPVTRAHSFHGLPPVSRFKRIRCVRTQVTVVIDHSTGVDIILIPTLSYF